MQGKTHGGDEMRTSQRPDLTATSPQRSMRGNLGLVGKESLGRVTWRKMTAKGKGGMSPADRRQGGNERCPEKQGEAGAWNARGQVKGDAGSEGNADTDKQGDAHRDRLIRSQVRDKDGLGWREGRHWVSLDPQTQTASTQTAKKTRTERNNSSAQRGRQQTG